MFFFFSTAFPPPLVFPPLSLSRVVSLEKVSRASVFVNLSGDLDASSRARRGRVEQRDEWYRFAFFVFAQLEDLGLSFSVDIRFGVTMMESVLKKTVLRRHQTYV